MQESLICCPSCHTSLPDGSQQGDLNCPVCGYHYRNQDGILDFSPENRFYWGEISQADMQKVNAQAEKQGWFQAFINQIATSHQRDMAKYLLDPVRIAGLFHYYNPDKHGVCVDLGSGWGPLSFGLSKFYDTVYSLDGVYERLRFQSIRAGQEQVNNIKILKSSLLNIPLCDRSADTVIVNGLLEWIGLSDTTTPPRDLQVHFLKEVYRILKPGGRLFIGIENRTGAQFFMGSRDHSGLKFTSLMPRWLANRVVQRAQRMKDASYFSGAETSYRTLTYTYWGYRHLLGEAGFPETQIYWALPSYNEPNASGTLDGSSARYYLRSMISEVRDPKRRALIKGILYLPRPLLGLMIKLFSPHFFILAGKGKTEDTLQEHILGQSAHRSILRTSQSSSKNLGANFLVLNDSGMEKKVRVLCKNGKIGNGTQLEISEQTGISGWPVLPSSKSEVTKVAAWLGHFQQKESRGEWSFGELEDELQQLVENAVRLSPQLTNLLNSYRDVTLSMLKNCKIQRVQENGCLIPQSVFIQPDGSVHVTDWSQARPSGHPWMDAGTFIVTIPKENHAARKAFEQEYTRWIDTPVHLAPAYSILRSLQADFGAEPVNAQNYLGLSYWTLRLQTALAHALSEQQPFLIKT